MGENVFPLSPDNYEKLLRHFRGTLNKLSEPHFEIQMEDCYTLKLPKLNRTWSDIGVVFLRTQELIHYLTTGLTREAFQQVYVCAPETVNDPLVFIVSLFHYLEKEVTNDIIENQSILETVEQVLTRPLQDQEIKQEDSLGSLNMKLINLIVSTSVVRSQLKYICSKLKYVDEIVKCDSKLISMLGKHKMIESLRKHCEDRLLDVEILEKRTNTNITVVRNLLSLELRIALTTFYRYRIYWHRKKLIGTTI
jgi:hypothetical protein